MVWGLRTQEAELSLRTRITRALEACPDATSVEIARHLRCQSAYVRTVKQRILIAKNKPPGPPGGPRRFVKVAIADFRHLIRDGETPEAALARLFRQEKPS